MFAQAPGQEVPTEIHEKSNIIKIAEGLQQGILPSNVQINTELDATKLFLAPQIPVATSAKEEKVLTDAVKLVEAAQTTLETKNSDEKVQQLVKAVETAKNFELSSAPLEVREQITQFLDGVKNLTMSVVNSADYRKALTELFSLLQEMLFIGADQFQDSLPREDVGDMTLEEAMNTASDMAETVKNIDTKNIPEEQKRAFKKHLKEFLRSLDAEGLRQGMEGFMEIWQALSDNMLSKLERTRVNSDVNRVGATAKAVLEEFTGQKTLDDFLVNLRGIMDSVANDKELQNYFHDIREYLLAAIEKPELIDTDYFSDQGNDLLERGQNIMEKYRNDNNFIGIFEEARQLAEEIKNDDALNLLQNRATEFFGNFVATDAGNNPQVDFELIDKMKSNLVPFLAERIKELPLRRIVIQDKDYEYLIFDDLRVSLEKLLPEHIKFHIENSTNLSIRGQESSNSTTRVSFSIQNLKPRLHNFYFFLKRKSIPAITDEGRMNAFVKGSGMTIRGSFNLKQDTCEGTILSDHVVKVNISRLQIDILKANHEVILNMATFFMGNQITQWVEQLLEQSIDDMIGEYGKVLHSQVFSKFPTPEAVVQQGIEAIKSGIPL